MDETRHPAGAPLGHHHHDPVAFDSPEVAAYAELEGEVLDGIVQQAADVLAGLARDGGLEVHRLLDLGCGAGVGTTTLARRFPEATVEAVDGSAAMVARATARLERLGLGDRARAHWVQLPEGIDALEPADLVWASMVVHHLGDEAAVLRRARRLLRPGGLVALVEREAPVRVLPEGDDLGRPGLWSRLESAWDDWFEQLRAEPPGAVPSEGYPAMLEAAGYTVVADRALVVELDPPLSEPARRFAREQVRRAHGQLAGRVDEADLDALARLVDEQAAEGLLRRADACVHAARHLYVARSGR